MMAGHCALAAGEGGLDNDSLLTHQCCVVVQFSRWFFGQLMYQSNKPS
jgi:hypothetical protein